MALTVIADAARRLVGPDAQTGANDAGGPIGSVAGLAAISQQRARSKGSPVGLRLVQQVPVLHARRPHATWKRDTKKKNEPKREGENTAAAAVRAHSILTMSPRQRVFSSSLGADLPEPNEQPRALR